MNKYMQTDKRWGSLGYPKKPYTIRNCGCGEVSICNCIIEMDQYKKQTPKTILPYCRQYADPNGNGTYWSGIPAMMKHYGMTQVKEHQTMKPLWTELAKENRVAVFLMGSKRGGSRGVHWTSSGHFVCATRYKHKDGKNWVYVKDSYSNSSLRNGWIAYEDNMRGDVLKVWSGKLNSKKASKPKAPAEKPKEPAAPTWADKAVKWAHQIANDQSWHYVRYDLGKKAHQCPICHKHKVGKFHGWNCIGFAYSCLFHGAGINIKHDNGVINNAKAEAILHAKSAAEARNLACNALKCEDFKVIRNGGKTVPQAKLKAGDVCLYFKGNTYQHTFFYIGNGRMIDCTSAGSEANNIKERNALAPKVVIRYTGK